MTCNFFRNGCNFLLRRESKKLPSPKQEAGRSKHNTVHLSTFSVATALLPAGGEAGWGGRSATERPPHRLAWRGDSPPAGSDLPSEIGLNSPALGLVRTNAVVSRLKPDFPVAAGRGGHRVRLGLSR